MQRAFLLNILFLIFVNLLIKPFFIFGIDRTIQNQVGLEAYGIYAALFNFTLLFYIVNDFGIQNFNSQSVSQDNQLLQSYFSNILLLKIGLGFLYSCIVFFLASLIGYSGSYYYLLSFLLLNNILRSFLLYFRTNVSALGFYKTDSLLSVLERLILIVLCSILLWANPWNKPFQIEWFIYAQTISLFFAALVAGAIVYRRIHIFKFELDRHLLADLLKKSAPFALVILLMTIYTRIDFVMIERLLPDGKRVSGIYASAYRLLDAVAGIGILFSGLLLPMFAKLLKEKAPISPLLQLSARLIFCGTISTAISVCFFRFEIMDLLYTHASSEAAEVLGILIFTFIVIGGGYIYGTLLTANNSLVQLNKLFVISVLLNIIFNLYCIPRWGAVGAAIATLVTQGFALLGQIVVAQKVFQLKKDYSLLLQVCSFTILMIGLAFVGYHYGPFHWGGNFLLVLGLGFLGGFVVRLLNFRWLKEQAQTIDF